MKNIKKLICLLFGHDDLWNDSGYDVCSRCGKHEYYDEDYYNSGYLVRPYWWIKWRIIYRLIDKWRVYKGEIPF